jgi:hypothetical protein
MSVADPIDLTETVLILERMVGSRVSIEVEVLPDEDVGVLRTSGVLGPHRIGTLTTASGDESGHHAFLLDPDEETGLSFDGFNLNGSQFIAAYRGYEDRIVTILLGITTNDERRVPTVKLTVAQQ